MRVSKNPLLRTHWFFQVNLKKIRMGMPTFVDRPESDEDEAPKLPDFDDEEDKTKRCVETTKMIYLGETR